VFVGSGIWNGLSQLLANPLGRGMRGDVEAKSVSLNPAIFFSLARLSHFAGFESVNSFRFSGGIPRVFTTRKADWRTLMGSERRSAML
jgi:hypothetical protein